MTETPEKLPESETAQTGRNEPCPCGSGKKYKRCHGIAAAPKLSQPKMQMGIPAGAQTPPGLDQMDPQMMMQVSQMLQRLPKGQVQKLQGLMQRAMSGKDVSRESAEFEKSLPLEFQEMLKGFQMPGMGGEGTPGAMVEVPSSGDEPMTPEKAKAIVAAAAAKGTISEAQAEDLLKAEVPTPAPSVFSRLFKKK